MSVLWFTGFEGGNEDLEPFGVQSGTRVIVNTASVRTGTYGCQVEAAAGYADSVGQLKACNNNMGGIDQPFTLDCRGHFALKVDTLPSASAGPVMNEEMFWYHYKTGTAECLVLTIDSDGKIGVYLVNNVTQATTLLGRSSTDVNDGEWHLIQVKDDYHGGSPAHSYELIIDKVSEVSGTDSTAANAVVTTVYLGKLYQNAFDDKSYKLFIDDVIITSDSYIDYPFSIECVVPTGDGNYVNWAPIGVGTSNWGVIDEIPPDGIGVSYIWSATTDQKDSVSCAGLSLATGKNIASVRSNYVCKRGAAGANVRFFLRDSGGTDNSTSTNQPLLTIGAKAFAQLFNTDPVTSSAWLVAGVDACEIGIQQKVGDARLQAAQLHILYEGVAGSPMIAYNFGG